MGKKIAVVAKGRSERTETREAPGRDKMGIDELTGLLDRTSGIDLISDMCSEMDGAVLIFDLDCFKLVNDLFGHDLGDKILRAIADIIRKSIRSHDVICRSGGDEFLGFFPGMEKSALGFLTERLNNQLRTEAKRLLGDDHGIPLGVSVGAVMIPEYGREYDDLFRMADDALYMSKVNGKHCCHVYCGDLPADDTLTAKDELERVSDMLEERYEGGEALVMGTEIFSTVYHFLTRLNKDHGCRAMRVLFLLSLKADGGMEMDDAMRAFEDHLKRTLSGSDIILKCKLNQYLAVLPMTDEKEAEDKVDRMIKEWDKSPEHEGCRIDYTMDEC